MPALPAYSSTISYPNVQGKYLNFSLSHLITSLEKVIALFDPSPAFQYVDAQGISLVSLPQDLQRNYNVASAGFLSSIPNQVEYEIPLLAINVLLPSIVYGSSPTNDTFTVLQIDTTKCNIEPGFSRLQATYTWTQSVTSRGQAVQIVTPTITTLYGANGYLPSLGTLNATLINLSSYGNLCTVSVSQNNYIISYVPGPNTYSPNQLIFETTTQQWGATLGSLFVSNLATIPIYTDANVSYDTLTNNYQVVMTRNI